MAEKEQTETARKTRRSPRRIAKWLFRFALRSIAVVAVTLLLVAIVAAIVYANRVRIVNQTLDILAEPYDVSVGEIDLHRLGQVRIADLRLSPKGVDSEQPLALINEATITYDIAELRSTRQLKAIHLKNAEVKLNDRTLASDSSPADNAPGTPAGFDLSILAYFTDSFTVSESHIDFDRSGAPRVKADWAFKTGPLNFGDDGLTHDPLELELSNIQVGEKSSIAGAAVDARVNRDFSRIEIGSISVEKPDLVVTPELFPPSGESEPKNEPGPGPPSDPVEVTINSIALTDASVAIEDFPKVPDLFFNTELNTSNLAYQNGSYMHSEPLVLRLDDFAVGETGAQLASADFVELTVESLDALTQRQTVSAIVINGLDAVVTDETLAFLSDEPGEGGGSSAPWIIEKAAIDDGRLVLRDATFGDSPSPRIETEVEARLEDLRFGASGFSSEGEQTLLLSQSRIWAPGIEGGENSLLAFQRAEMSLSWPEFDRNFEIERLAIRSPVFEFTDESLGDWIDGVATDSAPRPRNRPVYKVEELSVTDGKFIADTNFAEKRVPILVSDFSMETIEGAEDPFSYRLNFSDLQIRNHAREAVPTKASDDPTLFPDNPIAAALSPLLEEDVLKIEDIDLDFTADELQRTRRLQKVRVSGATLKVGEGLKSLVDPGTTAETEEETERSPDAAAPPREPTWTIGEVEVTNSRVEFQALIPQVEGLEFTIETTLSEIPLSVDGLLAQDKLQKVEIAGIEIKDPYNSFITVAELPTIFVQFSLAGLAAQEIENIDLIAPSLYVGQGLFWWIEYQRNFREQNEGASVGLEGGGPVKDTPDWTIKTLNANSGKIVIAPTGVPLGVVPFPFNATTTMSDGNIELKLNIPEEEYVYQFPRYKVDLYGLTGDIQFNVPVETVDNNLVQTFSLDKAIWKDYEAENLYITVTFDAEGIYGLFGGDAYSGYAEGGFNFYLNQDGKWDAWISGTDLESGPLTQAIAPESFLMEGDISLKVISEGRDKSVGETTGEFTTSGPGWFDITRLNEIFEKFPDDWTNLQSSLAELSLIALKRFDYDKGVGSLYLFGREGELDLNFVGPYGKRDISLHAHDERNKTASVKPEPENVPQAAARPVR